MHNDILPLVLYPDHDPTLPSHVDFALSPIISSSANRKAYRKKSWKRQRRA